MGLNYSEKQEEEEKDLAVYTSRFLLEKPKEPCLPQADQILGNFVFHPYYSMTQKISCVTKH